LVRTLFMRWLASASRYSSFRVCLELAVIVKIRYLEYASTCRAGAVWTI
jgi:hypothetical protein